MTTHSPYFSLFPQLKIKLKGRHFDTIEVTEAELQGVLNTFTGTTVLMCLKKWQKHWEWCIFAEQGLLRG
jgi:hypothetical protein